MTNGSRRRWCGPGVVLAVIALTSLAGTVPAGAHAQLQGSDPVPDARLARAPDAVTLRFDEPVEAGLGAVRLFDGRGRPLRVGAPRPAGGGAVLRAPIDPLPDGLYVVSWRVTSADGHPVRGAFVFGVGSAPTTSSEARSLLERVLASSRGDLGVGVAVVGVRAFGFAATLVLTGALVGLGSWWPHGRDDRRARRVVGVALAVAAGSGVAAFVLHGPYVTGLGPERIADPSLWRDVGGTRTGAAMLARLVVLAYLAGLGRVLLPRRGPAAEHPLPLWWPAATGLGLVALATTWGLGGHAATGAWGPVALVVDAAHVLAAGVWLGGLVLLVAAALPGAPPKVLVEVLPRWSNLALGAVAVLVTTGVAQSVRQVGAVRDLTGSDYGRLLLVKIVVVLAVVVVAALSRDLVDRRWRAPRGAVSVPEAAGVAVAGRPAFGSAPGPGPNRPAAPEVAVADDLGARRALRRSVLAETVALGVIVLVTALLTNVAPPRSAAGGPFFETLRADPLRIDVTMSPGRPGPNEVHLYAFTGNGLPTDVLDMSAELSRPADGIEPIRIPLLRAGPGHYLSSGFTVPFAGDWTLRVGALAGPTRRVTAETTVPVR